MLITDLNELTNLCTLEEKRQQNTLSLIASENYMPQDICCSVNILSNKYAEGYPGKRYYAGCSIIDEIESCAIKACQKLFQVEYANVQLHSGSQANQAAFLAVLKPGDRIMGLNFAAGGHLTHGHSKNFSGIFFQAQYYTVDPTTEQIDYNQLEDAVKLHRPKLLIAGASAYPRSIDFAAFAAIAQRHNAVLLADIAHIAGLVATKQHASPVEHADIITGTTHKTLRGPRGGFILAKEAWAKKIDQAVMPGIQGGPHMHTIAQKAACFLEAHTQGFVSYQEQVIQNARALARELQSQGFTLVSDGTDTHLLIIKTEPLGLTGREAEERLEKIGITASRSSIPFDKASPLVTSGLRLGTAAITTRGMQAEHMREIAECIYLALCQDNPTVAKERITQLARAFPIPERYL